MILLHCKKKISCIPGNGILWMVGDPPVAPGTIIIIFWFPEFAVVVEADEVATL